MDAKVATVDGTAPISSSGGTTPAISIAQANASTDGDLSSADWNTFNNKGSGTVTSVTGSSPISVATGTTTPAISLGTVPIANGGTDATTAADARTNLGLETMAIQNANAVAVTGGAIDGTAIGGTTPAAGAFSSLRVGTTAIADASGNATWQAASGSGMFLRDTSGTTPVIRGNTAAGYIVGNDDFVFGSPQLANDGNGSHDTRMFFDKSKGAFRAGYVNSDQWDDNGNVGDYSTAMGAGTTANGNYSTAMGYVTEASGYR